MRAEQVVVGGALWVGPWSFVSAGNETENSGWCESRWNCAAEIVDLRLAMVVRSQLRRMTSVSCRWNGGKKDGGSRRVPPPAVAPERSQAVAQVASSIALEAGAECVIPGIEGGVGQATTAPD